MQHKQHHEVNWEKVAARLEVFGADYHDRAASAAQEALHNSTHSPSARAQLAIDRASNFSLLAEMADLLARALRAGLK